MTALVLTYNHERYVREAIASALDQTRPPDELIVVDDGSTDRTLEIVSSIDDRRVRVVALPHRGIGALAESYTRGVAESRGRLIAILEGDDRWPPDKLKVEMRAFDDPEVVLAHGIYRVIGAGGATLHPGVRPHLPVPAGRYDARPFLLRDSYIMGVTSMFRRDPMLAIGGFRQLVGTPHWDYPTFLELSRAGDFAFVPHVLGEWRRHRRSAVYQLAGIDLRGVDLSQELALEARSQMTSDTAPSPDEIRRSWSDAYARMIWQAARILLVGRRYQDARSLVEGSLRRPASLRLRIQLVLAWIASLAGVDLEGLTKLRRRRSVFEELD